jgi:hypothetical protein
VSWFSKALHGVGHLAEKAAPYVGLIPGVGTMAGAAIGGLGGLAAGDGLGGALKYGAMGAAGGYGGAALRGLSTGGKALAVGSSLLHGGGPPTAPGQPPNGVGDPNAPVNLDPNTGLEVMDSGGQAGGIGSYLKNALGGINPVTAGLGALGVVNAGQLGAKANKYAEQGYNSAAGSYAERAGLRKAGIQGLMNPTTPDTSGLTKIRSSNPYSGVAA